MYTCTDNIKALIHNYILRVIFEIKIYIESLYLNFIQYRRFTRPYLPKFNNELLAINSTCHSLQNFFKNRQFIQVHRSTDFEYYCLN